MAYRKSCTAFRLSHTLYPIGVRERRMQQQSKRGASSVERSPSWDDLKLFLQCSSYRSFRAAAEALDLAGPTLMRRIERLEGELGFKVFLRERAGILLTEEG